MSQIRFVNSNIGQHKQVVYKNYLYWWFVDNKTSSRYICCKKATNKCKGSITIADGQVIRESDNHNHLGICNEEIEVLCGKQEMKLEVELNLSSKPNEIYKIKQASLQSIVPNEVLVKSLPSFNEMRSTLAKRRAKHIPKIPTQFSNLKIEGKYAVTSNGKQFLRYDNNSKDQRVIILFSDAALKILKESKDWFCDGTFKAAPKQLMQIYTIHGLYKNHLFPCVFALTSKKDEKTYKLIFKVLKNIASDQDIILNPTSIVTDFEKASIKSFVFHFPNVIVRGCWFHFRQALFKNVVKFGLKTDYYQYTIKKFVNQLGALALIPVDKINDALTLIKNNIPDKESCKRLVEYFERTWLNTFEPKLWNHYLRYDEKTNNRVESFHSTLNSTLSSNHPNIYTLLDKIKTINSASEIDFDRVKSGKTVRIVKKEELKKIDQLNSLKRDYEEGLTDFNEFFDLLSAHIDYPIYDDDSDEESDDENDQLPDISMVEPAEVEVEDQAEVEVEDQAEVEVEDQAEVEVEDQAEVEVEDPLDVNEDEDIPDVLPDQPLQPAARAEQVSQPIVLSDLVSFDIYTEQDAIESEARVLALEKLNELHPRDIELEAYLYHNKDVAEARRSFFVNYYQMALRQLRPFGFYN